MAEADVTDDEFRLLVARSLDTDPDGLEIVSVTVEPVAYDVPAITTAARWWVRGEAQTSSGRRTYSMFVKHIQSWSRSPYFAFVPEHLREFAERSVPWRTEALVYRSDLHERLPRGLRMPRALGVYDIDEKSAGVWLEAVDTREPRWSLEDFAEAARLIGRLNARSAVRELSSIGEVDMRWSPETYVYGRVGSDVAPTLRDDAIWRHPLVSTTFDEALRDDMRAALDSLPGYVAELDRVPLGAAHGDTCPNNLLRTDDDGFTLIDFGFWSTQPLAFDLAQLVLGDVHMGRLSMSAVPAVERACLTGYVDGLREEDCHLDAVTVRRSYLLKALIYTGLSALPVEDLNAPTTPEVTRAAGERAAMARYLLDEVAASTPLA